MNIKKGEINYKVISRTSPDSTTSNEKHPYINTSLKKSMSPPSTLSSSAEFMNPLPKLNLSNSNSVRKIVNLFDKNETIKRHLFLQEEALSLNNIDKNNIHLILSYSNKNNEEVELSKKLSNIFNKRTYKIFQNTSKKHFSSQSSILKAFRSKIMKDFSNEQSKIKIIASKKNYKHIFKFLDQERNEKIIKAKELEKKFYLRRNKTNLPGSIPCENKYYYSNGNTHTTTGVKRKKVRKSVTQFKMKTVEGGFQIYKFRKDYASKIFADSLLKLDCPQYEKVVQGKLKDGRSFSSINLERIIRVLGVKENGYDQEEDVLLEKNTEQLKHLLEKTKTEISTTVKDTNPLFIKKTIKQSTLKKFREFDGMFFGLPV